MLNIDYCIACSNLLRRNTFSFCPPGLLKDPCHFIWIIVHCTVYPVPILIDGEYYFLLSTVTTRITYGSMPFYVDPNPFLDPDPATGSES